MAMLEGILIEELQVEGWHNLLQEVLLIDHWKLVVEIAAGSLLSFGAGDTTLANVY